MRYIVFAMGGVFLLDLFLGMTTAYTARVSLISYLTRGCSCLSRAASSGWR